VAACERTPPERQAPLEAAGVRVLRLPADGDGRVELRSLAKRLLGEGIRSLMVEGGTRIITAFLAARLVDRIVITLTPYMVGGLRAVDNLRNTELENIAGFENLHHLPLGPDLLLWGDLRWDGEPGGD
jgi:riboflavin biosynthesis pyrimidine reductase